MKRMNMFLNLYYVAFILIVTACTRQISFRDKSESTNFTQIAEATNDYFGSPVWLAENEIIFFKGQQSHVLTVILYNLETSTEHNLMFDASLNGCDLRSYEAWGRLDDNILGIIVECRDNNGTLTNPGYYLIAWQVREQTFELLVEYPRSIHPDKFAISPDQNEIVQQVTGDGINNKLYHVSSSTNHIEQLFAEYYRVGLPSWSTTGELIVFGASETGAVPSKNIFSGYFGLKSALESPWNLYTMNPTSLEPKLILSDIQYLDSVKWAPRSTSLIAFRGKYQEKLGLWLYDIDDAQFTFLHQELGTRRIQYDWSPDGKKIILLECFEQTEDIDDSPICYPIILNVSVE